MHPVVWIWLLVCALVLAQDPGEPLAGEWEDNHAHKR